MDSINTMLWHPNNGASDRLYNVHGFDLNRYLTRSVDVIYWTFVNVLHGHGVSALNTDGTDLPF